MTTTRSAEIVVTVGHPLDADHIDDWYHLFAPAANRHPRRLVADLAACPGIDASGIVLLLKVHRELAREDGVLVLRRPADRVRRLLTLARVAQVLTIEN